MTDAITDRINYLANTLPDIERAIKNVTDEEILEFKLKEEFRTEKTIAVFYEMLGGIPYETTA